MHDALALGLVGCAAEAAEPDLQRSKPLASSLESDAGVDMTELSILDRPLEPALDRVEPFLPDWRMPPHEAGELPRWIRHQTIPRETIEQLALRYGVDPGSLRKWNELAADEQPHPRKPKPLRIFARSFPPPREQVEHVVESGEGWGSIARRYGVDSSTLRAWNVSETGRSLEPGEQLVVWVDPIVLDSILHDQPSSARAALVRPGAHGVGTPQAGVLVAGVQLPPGEGYELRYPNSAWGTSFAVREAIAALDRFAARSDYPRPISVGTMSRQRGGKIGGHNSHQTGRDLDIRLPLRVEVPPSLAPIPRRVDWQTTWALVSAFAEADSVEVIFLDYGSQRRLYRAAQALGVDEEVLAATLQYPRGSKANLGLVRHAPGHEGHIHLRFACGPAEPECG
ncbi:MAG: penicillin-insensitive murein endopeptidase [Enhygromyxa sp.]